MTLIIDDTPDNVDEFESVFSLVFAESLLTVDDLVNIPLDALVGLREFLLELVSIVGSVTVLGERRVGTLVTVTGEVTVRDVGGLTVYFVEVDDID